MNALIDAASPIVANASCGLLLVLWVRDRRHDSAVRAWRAMDLALLIAAAAALALAPGLRVRAALVAIVSLAEAAGNVRLGDAAPLGRGLFEPSLGGRLLWVAALMAAAWTPLGPATAGALGLDGHRSLEAALLVLGCFAYRRGPRRTRRGVFNVAACPGKG